MRVGIHLAQFGRALTPDSVRRSAVHAEELGYDDVWVSDHLVVPADQPFPSPELADPLISLATAAAVTERVGIGTNVLVGPQYTSPLQLANSLATLDHGSNGRLTVGLGIGWSPREYEALGAAYSDRGARLDEIIQLLRAVWTDDPTAHEGTFYPSFTDLRVLPKPVGPMPVWVGGASDAAIERAIRVGDGYTGNGGDPDDVEVLVERLRDARPDPSFTISFRVDWDARSHSPDEIADQYGRYAAAGVQHVVVAPVRGSIEPWLEGMAVIGDAVGLTNR